MIRPVSLCLAYYMNPGMLELQLKAIEALPDELRAQASIVVVDDGSPLHPAARVMREWTHGARLTMKCLRHTEDIPWNQDAARNLAVGFSFARWVIVTDMDHVPSEALWRKVMTSPLDDRYAFQPSRLRLPGPAPYKTHPNSYVMTTDTYWRAGGYDERFRGIYGTDGAFRRRLDDTSRVVQLKEPLILYPREVQSDASTTTLSRKSDAMHDAKKARDAEVKATGDLVPKHFLTPYERQI